MILCEYINKQYFMKLICKECGAEFESERSTRHFCSRKCSIDNRKKDESYLKKLRVKKVKKEKETKKCKHCNNEFYDYIERQFCSVKCANLYNLPEHLIVVCKECGNEFSKLPCSKQEFCSNTCARRFTAKDPDYLTKLSLSCKERSKNPEYLEKLSAAHSATWQKPEFREKMNDIIKSDEWIEKVEVNSKRFKDYILPSGKTVRLQGYENYALDILLKDFDESDLFIQRKEIEDEIGKITYMYNGNEHSYYPDIYIKSLNKIIEVKSKWTYKSQYELNRLKEQACLDKGLCFEFMIL